MSCREGLIYHIYNRGAGKAPIFLSSKDKDRFLQGLYLFNNKNKASNMIWRLHRSDDSMSFSKMISACKKKKISRECLVSIVAYCLKDNHYHLLLKEKEKGGVSLFMQKMGGYSRYFNNTHARKGAVYERRYRQHKITGQEQLRCLLGYINVIEPLQEVVPVENIEKHDKGWLRRLIDNFHWSSHRDYLKQKKKTLLERSVAMSIFSGDSGYSSFVDSVLQKKEDIWKAKHLFLD